MEHKCSSHHFLSKWRRPFSAFRSRGAFRAQAGKGFGKQTAQPGTKDKPRKRPGLSNEEAVKKAMDIVDKTHSAPVDPAKAAEGRIDYAKVKDWRAGQNKDVGSLEVESFVGGNQQGRQIPFYNDLTVQAVTSQQNGELDDLLFNMLKVPGKKVPPQDKWTYKLEHYVSYLVDLQAVHHILESSIAEALAAQTEDTGIRSALLCFSESKGLNRSLEIAADLTNLDSSDSRETDAVPSISSRASAYIDYLKEITQESITSPAAPANQEACLKLMTHVYCAHLQHLTNGSKIGAEFATKRNLFQKRAVNMYRRYPYDVMGKDPLVALQRNTNQAGASLSSEEKAVMKKEVAVALAHSVQLFEALARDD